MSPALVPARLVVGRRRGCCAVRCASGCRCAGREPFEAHERRHERRPSPSSRLAAQSPACPLAANARPLASLPSARPHPRAPPCSPATSPTRSERDAEVSSLRQAVAERDVKLKSAKAELLESRMALQQKDTELKVRASVVWLAGWLPIGQLSLWEWRARLALQQEDTELVARPAARLMLARCGWDAERCGRGRSRQAPRCRVGACSCLRCWHVREPGRQAAPTPRAGCRAPRLSATRHSPPPHPLRRRPRTCS